MVPWFHWSLLPKAKQTTRNMSPPKGYEQGNSEVRIPDDAVIPDDKLTKYLLVPRPHRDKSRFLARAGFVADNPRVLMAALRQFAASTEAMSDGYNEYGEFLRQEGELRAADGRSLAVVAIWLRWRVDGSVHFVTLKPRKEHRT